MHRRGGRRGTASIPLPLQSLSPGQHQKDAWQTSRLARLFAVTAWRETPGNGVGSAPEPVDVHCILFIPTFSFRPDRAAGRRSQRALRWLTAARVMSGPSL